MPRERADEQHVPTIGDRVEMRRNGVIRGGIVHYADSIQALVKWDDGASSSLRIGQRALSDRRRPGSTPAVRSLKTA